MTLTSTNLKNANILFNHTTRIFQDETIPLIF